MPGTPATSPNFNLPRYADSDSATFSADINPIVDGLDSQACRTDDARLSDMRIPRDASVTSTKIADGAVLTQKIIDGAVVTSKIAMGAVTSNEIADGTVQDVDLAPNSVTTGKIAAGAVTTGGIADGAVTIAKLAAAAQQQTMYTTGDLKLSLATVPPPGWLLCDGSAISRGTYANLFAVFGTTYGAGDGSSTFNLPDLRGRALVGAGQGAGLTNRPLGSNGGEERHALTIAEMASHNHGITDPGHNHGLSDPGHAHSIYDPGHAHSISDPGHAHAVGNLHPSGNAPLILYNPGGLSGHGSYTSPGTGTQGTDTRGTGIGIYAAGTGIGIYSAGTGITLGAAGTGVSVQNQGGGTAHNNLQPYVAVNYFVKT